MPSTERLLEPAARNGGELFQAAIAKVIHQAGPALGAGRAEPLRASLLGEGENHRNVLIETDARKLVFRITLRQPPGSCPPEKEFAGLALLPAGLGPEALYYDGSTMRERRPGDVGRRQVVELTYQLPLHALDQPGIDRHEHGHGVGIVLRLSEQVRRDGGGVGARVREHDQLGGAREHVDRDCSGDELLRSGHPAVPWSDDHVSWRDRTRTIGERRDRLGPARGEHPFRARDCGRGER